MNLKMSLAVTVLLSLTVSACAIEISDITPPGAPAPGLTHVSSTFTATPPPTPTITLSLPTASPTPGTINIPPTLIPTSLVPITWADLNLTGQLIFVTSTTDLKSDFGFTLNVASLDLAHGTLKTVFQGPVNAWINSVAASPAGDQILMTYAPPPSPGQAQYGYTGLYLLPSDGSGPPQPVLEHAASKESFFQPVWSPDGQHIYYAHLQVVTDANGTPGAKYTIERLTLPNGQPVQVAENAYWPRLSPDGSKLAYVSFDPTSYSSKLYVANPDGSNAAQITLPDTLVVDAPLFSPDGQWLYFSGADLAPPAASSRTSPWRWLDQLLGVKTASAHNIPSDWWRVPVAGGQPQQLTELYDSGLYGVFLSEGQVMVFITITGLFVMKPDGTDLRMILPGTGTYGTVDWIP